MLELCTVSSIADFAIGLYRQLFSHWAFLLRRICKRQKYSEVGERPEHF